MQFATLHQLSRQLDLPDRVIRYKFTKLRLAGKLKEPDDFHREHYVDDHHFLWKVNPLSFLRETALSLPKQPTVNNPPPSGDNVVNEPTTFATKTPPIVNQPPPFDTKTATKAHEPERDREFIDLLKGQLQIKDQQITQQAEEIKRINDLNVKLVGQTACTPMSQKGYCATFRRVMLVALPARDPEKLRKSRVGASLCSGGTSEIIMH